ncbi:MAG: DUF2878 domain-containing protein [Planctomycetota bacterium]
MNLRNLESLLIFQVGWWCAVGGAGAGYPVGATVGVTALVLLGWLIDRKASEIRIGLAALLLGFLADGTLLRLDIYEFPPNAQLGILNGLPPVWMAMLWPLLVRTLEADKCLGWLQNRYFLAVILGVVSGPLAYWGGESLGALTFTLDSTKTMILVGLMWGFALPGLLLIRRFFETGSGRMEADD